MSLFGYASYFFITAFFLAQPAQIHIRVSDSNWYIIEKKYLSASNLFNQLFHNSQEDDYQQPFFTLIIPNQSIQIRLLGPCLKIATPYTKKELRQLLHAHTINELAQLITAANYCDVPYLQKKAIAALAHKLCFSSHALDCLKNPQGSYHLNLVAPINNLLAQKMLTYHTFLSQQLSLKPLEEKSSKQKQYQDYYLRLNHQNNLIAFVQWGYVQVKEYKDGKFIDLFDLMGHTAAINSLEFSPTDNNLISASNDGTCRIWNIDTGVLHTLVRGAAPFAFACFNKQGTEFTTIDAIGRTGIYTTANPQKITSHTPVGQRMFVTCAQFDTTNRYLGLGSFGWIDLFDRACDTARALKVQNFFLTQVKAIDFSTDSALLGACDDSGTIKLWDVTTGNLLRVIRSDEALLQGAYWHLSLQPAQKISNKAIFKAWKHDIAGFFKLLTATQAHHQAGFLMSNLGVRVQENQIQYDLSPLQAFLKKDIEPEQVTVLNYFLAIKDTHKNTQFPGIFKILFPRKVVDLLSHT